jgi:hypothetical protein
MITYNKLYKVREDEIYLVWSNRETNDQKGQTGQTEYAF